MSAQSRDKKNHSSFGVNPSHQKVCLHTKRCDLKEDEIPYSRVIPFCYDSFPPNRRKAIRFHIEKIIERILICPQMKPAYIHEINKILIIEMGGTIK